MSQLPGSLVVDAVWCEPFSGGEFPISGKTTEKIRKSSHPALTGAGLEVSNHRMHVGSKRIHAHDLTGKGTGTASGKCCNKGLTATVGFCVRGFLHPRH